MRTSNIVKDSQSSREVSGSATAMSIDEASSVFLMDALGKLYSRPAQASLREYLSNAADAHAELGGDLPPIQVTLPNASSSKPTLSVRDFGAGMSESQFENVLSRYGASTKRDTNKLHGGFGLGAKSGFAISDEFFMTSYQQGKGIRVRIFKDALNKGYIDVIDRFATEEPDGLLVEVPVPSANVYELNKLSLLEEFPFFLAYGGEHPIDVTSLPKGESMSVHDSKRFTALELNGQTTGWFSKTPKYANKTLFATIGKVTYSVNLGELYSLVEQGKSSDKELLGAIKFLSDLKWMKVINVPIGSVDLPSSREEITYSERSLQTLAACICNFVRMMKQKVQSELNAQTRRGALNYVWSLETANYADMASLVWKGEDLNKSLFTKSKVQFVQVSNEHNYRNEWEITTTTAKSFKTFKGFSNVVSKNSHVITVEVPTEAEVKTMHKKMSVEALLSYLKIDTTLPYRNVPTSTIVFAILPDGDALNDWILNKKTMDVPMLEKIIEGKALALKLAEEKKVKDKERRAALAITAQKAKETRALNMLSNFTLSPKSASHQLSRNTVEKVFGNPTIKKYYWSEEEISKTAKKMTPEVFPFVADAGGIANTFSVPEAGGRGYSRKTLLSEFRTFLLLFLPEGSRIIVLGKAANLEQFKASYPEVESAVTVVRDAAEKQLKDEYSQLNMAVAAAEATVYSKYRRPLTNLLTFRTEVMKAKKEHSLPLDLASALTRLNQYENSKEICSHTLTVKYLKAMLAGFGFTKEKAKEVSTYSMEAEIKQLEDKYSLLVKGEFGLTPEIVTDLLSYAEMKNK